MADTTRPSEDQRLLSETLVLLAPVVDELTVAFDDRLSTECPRVRAAFRRGLVPAMIALATRYDRPGELIPVLSTMGRRHERLGIGIEDYAAVGALLIRAMRDLAGTAWTPAYQGAWVRAYTFAAGTMLRAGSLVDEEEQPLAA
jgi:hemoglobin-like flavoprotein